MSTKLNGDINVESQEGINVDTLAINVDIKSGH